MQALQLVVVAVHARALSLLYVDQLLEDVKQVRVQYSGLLRRAHPFGLPMPPDWPTEVARGARCQTHSHFHPYSSP